MRGGREAAGSVRPSIDRGQDASGRLRTWMSGYPSAHLREIDSFAVDFIASRAESAIGAGVSL